MEVDEDLAARSAGAGLAHGPEVVLLAAAVDALGRQAGELRPEVEGLVVLFIDGGEQPVGGQAPDPGHQVPGEADGVLLEVVAEGEVAQHLEEGVVARAGPDVLEVVVLARDAHALLHRDGARRSGFCAPRKTSLNWTMPALVNSRVGSPCGTRGELGTMRCPRSRKNSRKPAADVCAFHDPSSIVRLVQFAVQNGNDSTAGKALAVQVAGERAGGSAAAPRAAPALRAASRARRRSSSAVSSARASSMASSGAPRFASSALRRAALALARRGARRRSGAAARSSRYPWSVERSRASLDLLGGKAALARAWPPAPAGNAGGRRGAGRPSS